MRKSKRCKEIEKFVSDDKVYNIKEAISVLKKCPKLKFDESFEVSMKLGVDPKKSDQQVRGTVVLPNGTGKKIKILVLTKGDKVDEAKSAGADFVGAEDLIEKVKGGWLDFDTLIVTPDMMREVGRLGKILGPRGLMPSPKAGTVTKDVKKAIEDAKSGKVEYKVDKTADINMSFGKISFEEIKLEENINFLLKAINKAKPSASKGIYFRTLSLSTTMGPGLKIDLQSIGI